MSDCQHDWRWLDRPRVVINGLGQPNDHYNVECSRCGALGWAHGHAPNAPLEQLIHTPTAGRS